MVVKVFNCVARIAKHFKIGCGVICSIAISMMNKQLSFRGATVAVIEHYKFPIVSFEPFAFGYPIPIPFLGNLYGLQFVAAFFGTCKGRFSKELKTNNTRSQNASSSPVWIRVTAQPLSLSTLIVRAFPFTSTDATAKSSTSTFDLRWTSSKRHRAPHAGNTNSTIPFKICMSHI
jgi:hypothetical protein